MAEPIGIASGLLTLCTSAFKASITLYNTVKSFRNHPQRVRDLIHELEALSNVLRSLTGTISTIKDVDLSALELPLRRCGNACEEFEQEIKACLSRSGESRTSFRDWAKLKYMGDDIDGFRHMLAGYKSTINIALTDANLQKSSITVEKLESYRVLIKSATDDLEAHLQNIDGKLESIFARTVTGSDTDATELRSIKEERLSTQKCLQICSQLSDHINQIQLRPIQRSESSPGPADPEPLPERVTNDGLQTCQDSLRMTSAKLEKYMRDLVDRLMTKSKTAMTSEEDVALLARLREEWETVRQCIDICYTADTHLKENISIIENYATGDDTIQFLVSTDGKTVHGKNRGFGARQRQIGGHISDLSVQQISRDISLMRFQNVKDAHAASPEDEPPSVPDNVVENASSSDFQERWGRGVKLTSKSAPDIPVSAERSAEMKAERAQQH